MTIEHPFASLFVQQAGAEMLLVLVLVDENQTATNGFLTSHRSFTVHSQSYDIITMNRIVSSSRQRLQERRR
jgi:hypothetical protein